METNLQDLRDWHKDVEKGKSPMARIAEQTEKTRPHPGKTKIALLGLAILLIVGACAHQKAFKRGTTLSEEGQYERAIAELEEAVALAEKAGKDKAAQRYRQTLAEVQTEAAWFFYQRAETVFAQTDLGEAQMLIERCVTYCPQDQRYLAFRQRIEQAIADAEQRRGEALALANEGQWDEAIAGMTAALSQYRSLPGGDGDLRQIRERAYQHYLAQAEAKLHTDALNDAHTLAQQALSYKDNGSEAAGVLKTVSDRRQALDLIARGQAMLEQGLAQEALTLFGQAETLYPMQAELPTLLSRARQATCDLWIRAGRQAMEVGRHAAALTSFLKSYDLMADYGGIDALLAEARSQLAQEHLAASRHHLQNGNPGSAVVHAALALGYGPDTIEARQQLAQATEQVRQHIRYTIAFLGFIAQPAQQTLANSLASTTLEYLTHTRPTDVTLLDHSVPQTAIDPNTTNASAAPAADAHLTGEILDAKVSTQTKEVGRGESTYQDGYRPEPNPDHAQARAEVDEATRYLERTRRQLVEAEARLARDEHADPLNPQAQERRRRAAAEVAKLRQQLVDAATALGAAQARLEATPHEVLVPNMVKHEFPIEEVTWTATVRCQIKMVDTATGEVILAEQIEGQHTQSDRMVAADPAHNVPEDPLELPDNSLLLDAAARATTSKLKATLTATLSRHGQRFVNAMRRAEAAGDTSQAVDQAVNYLCVYPRGADHTQTMLEYLHRYLGEEDALVDLPALLRTHCQILQ